MPATAERMSRVDTAWLRMDNDVNLMMITGVWLISPAISLEAVRERIQDKLLQYDRFRQCVQPDALGARWVADADFDIAQHVVQGHLPQGAGLSERAALQQLCGELAATPLNPARPLWQFHLIENYEGGCALVARIHHCIGDGIALISVMMSITDGGTDPPKRAVRRLGAAMVTGADGADGADADSGDSLAAEFQLAQADWLTDTVLKPLTDATVKAIGLYGQGVAHSVGRLAQPQGAMMGTLDMARAGAQVISDVAALALLPDDSPTQLKGKPVGRKRVAWSEPMALADVKAVGRGLQCSINDVLLACVAGAIGEYLRSRGEDPAGKEIRAMVPVNLRPLDKAWQLGNRFGLAPLVLPIGEDNPVARVYAVQRRMSELKGSYQPLLAFGVLALSSLFVKPVQDALLGLFAKKATAVMTNVPGPAVPLRFCGAELRQTLFWVPASGDIGMGVSILSYGGGVQFGLMTDEKLCPEPQQIIDRFAPEFEKLLLSTLMLPWGEAA